MANFIVTEVITKNIRSAPLIKELTLSAGEKILDNEDILEITTNLVPDGFEMDVIVRVVIKEVREV